MDKGNSKFLNLLPRLSELIYDSNNNFGLQKNPVNPKPR